MKFECKSPCGTYTVISADRWCEYIVEFKNQHHRHTSEPMEGFINNVRLACNLIEIDCRAFKDRFERNLIDLDAKDGTANPPLNGEKK